MALPCALAAPWWGAELLFESDSLRIYRVRDADGAAHILLTNLDERGNRLAPEAPDPVVRNTAASQIYDTELIAPASGPVVAPPASVESTEPGTAIVININNFPPEPAPAAQPPVGQVFTSPIYAVGGVAGPIRYPDHQPFLGYGTDISSPSMFGGLGLNAGNGFGLQQGKTCRQGFDCMFPPRGQGR